MCLTAAGLLRKFGDLGVLDAARGTATKLLLTEASAYESLKRQAHRSRCVVHPPHLKVLLKTRALSWNHQSVTAARRSHKLLLAKLVEWRWNRGRGRRGRGLSTWYRGSPQRSEERSAILVLRRRPTEKSSHGNSRLPGACSSSQGDLARRGHRGVRRRYRLLRSRGCCPSLSLGSKAS